MSEPVNEPYVRVLRIHGAVDEGDLLLLADHLDDLLTQAPDVMVVDLSTCPRLTPGAVELLKRAESTLQARGAGLEVRAAEDDVQSVLKSAGLAVV